MNYNQYLPFILLNLYLVPTFGTLCVEKPDSSSTDCNPQTETHCTEKEILNSCGNRCERTCDDIKGTRVCPLICGPPACICTGNYVRHPNGQCVLPQECPKNCRQNETYTDCGSSCPKTCNPRSDAEFACPAVCFPGCFCRVGYVTSKNSCILPSDCPVSEKCFENEFFTECGSACPDTCDNYRNPNRICTKQCVQKCSCKSGYVLNEDRKCIRPDQCPPPKCGKNEVYNDCGTACPDTCSNLGTKRKCIAQCVTGCFCVEGYVRSANGNCVTASQCPVNETCTKPNEHYNPCGTKIQRSCSNFFNYSRPQCDCQEVCQCDSGHVRDFNGFCIKPQSCPNLCGVNEKFDCGSACDTECETLGETCAIQNIKCNEKCYCADGFARNSRRKCIPISECS